MTWNSDPLIYALDDSEKLVHVDAVANGAACGCICPSCKHPLIARNGGKKLIHHFAHRSSICNWAVETAVALLAYRIIRAEGRMRIQGATYIDLERHGYISMSPRGWLDVRTVVMLQYEENRLPALRISCIDEVGSEEEFVLVVTTTGYVSDSLYNQLTSENANALLMDFKTTYQKREATGSERRDRANYLMRIQSPKYIHRVLLGEADSDVFRWLFHPRRDAAQREMIDRISAPRNARLRAFALEGERQDEESRLFAENLRGDDEQTRTEARKSVIEAERVAFQNEGVDALPKVKRGACCLAEGCPLLGRADIATDCGAYEWSPNTCIFFEGERYYLIGCSARQNGLS